MVTVTTVIPTIGRPSLYERAIPSVLAQTFSDWECIVVGDGYQPEPQDDPRIRVESIPKAASGWKVGGVAAWNHGLSLARGEWVSYLADDDRYTPDHHRLLLSQASADVDFIYGRSIVRLADGRPTDRIFGNTGLPDAFDIVQGSYIARRGLEVAGDLEPGEEAWDARMLRRILPGVRWASVQAIVHDYFPAPENRVYHRLP